MRLLTVSVLRDPVVEAHGYPVDHPYVTDLWLPHLGPTATWVLHHLHQRTRTSQTGQVVVTVDELAASIGVRPNRVTAAVDRLHRFNVIVTDNSGHVRVRTHLSPLTAKQLARLPEQIQIRHWTHERHRNRPHPQPAVT